MHFESNTTSDWLNRMVSQSEVVLLSNVYDSNVTFKLYVVSNSCRERQRLFLKMVGEYGHVALREG